MRDRGCITGRILCYDLNRLHLWTLITVLQLKWTLNKSLVKVIVYFCYVFLGIWVYFRVFSYFSWLGLLCLLTRICLIWKIHGKRSLLFVKLILAIVTALSDFWSQHVQGENLFCAACAVWRSWNWWSSFVMFDALILSTVQKLVLDWFLDQFWRHSLKLRKSFAVSWLHRLKVFVDAALSLPAETGIFTKYLWILYGLFLVLLELRTWWIVQTHWLVSIFMNWVFVFEFWQSGVVCFILKGYQCVALSFSNCLVWTCTLSSQRLF